jgi:hypothetical protein
VVVTEATQAAVAAARAAGRSCWRVSSTLFAHIASDVVLQPLPEFVQAQQQQQQQQQSSDDTAAAAAVTAAAALALQAQYPPTPAGLQVCCERHTPVCFCSGLKANIHAWLAVVAPVPDTTKTGAARAGGHSVAQGMNGGCGLVGR